MAQTVGDVIGRGWRTGRAIGEDFSQWRFNRGEAKLQREFEERAAQEGKPLDAYAGEYENALAELYRGSGAAKRGVRGATGNALNLEALDSFQSRGARGASREASQMALGGNIVGSRNRLAQSAAGIGDYAGTMENMQARDQIHATTSAIGEDGSVDPFRLSQGIATEAARYGDAAGAASAAEGAHQARYQMASGIAGQIFQMLPNAAEYGDQIVGLFEGLKQYVPMAQNMDMRIGENGTPVIYMNGQAVGALDDPEELQGLMAQLQRDPRGVISAWEEAQVQSATAQGEWDRENAGAYRDARIAMVQEYAKAGGNPADVETVLSARDRADSAGWKNLAVDPATGNIMATVGGQIVQIVPGTTPIDPDGERGPGFEVIGSDGRIIDPSRLGADAQAGVDFALAVTNAQANARDAAAASALMEGLELLNRFEAGNTSVRRGGDTQSFPYEETDNYVRKILGATGRPSGSPREQARQVMDALVQTESGGNHSAVSPKGARGLTQVMPATAADPGYGVTPLRDNSPEEALRFGEDYLTALIEEFGDIELALAAYNAGPGTVKQWMDRGVVMAGSPAPAPRRTAAAAPAQTSALPTAPSAPAAAPVAPQRTNPSAERVRAALADFDREFGQVDPGSPEGRARAMLARDATDAHRGRLHAANVARASGIRREGPQASAIDIYSRYAGGNPPGTSPDANFDHLLEMNLFQ